MKHNWKYKTSLTGWGSLRCENKGCLAGVEGSIDKDYVGYWKRKYEDGCPLWWDGESKKCRRDISGLIERLEKEAKWATEYLEEAKKLYLSGEKK